MQKRRKKGLSTVVTTVLLVLIGIIAVVTVWVVIKNTINKNVEEIQDTSMLSMNLDIERAQIINNGNSFEAKISIKNSGGENISKIKIVVISDSSSQINTTAVGLAPLEKKTFNFTVNIANPTRVEVYPVFVTNGKEKTGSLADNRNVLNVVGSGATGTPAPGCTPNCAGKVCGSDGCSGSCGTCTSGTCDTNGQCVASCTPQTCTQLGKQCGTWDNGCGTNINCPTCASGLICSAGDCVYDMTQGLVAYYPFDDNVHDATGNGNNGGCSNCPLPATGKKNYAYQFDGSDDYVYVADSASLNPTQISVSAWVKMNSNNNPSLAIIGKTTVCASSGYLIWINENSNSNPLSLHKAGFWVGGWSDADTPTVDDNTWHHIVGTYDGSIRKIYVDGVERKSDIIGTKSLTSTSQLIIGGGTCGSYFPGIIDEVRIYNRGLSLAEISQLYNNP